jgi:hypothetical protein
MNVPQHRAKVAEELLSMHPAALDCTREETLIHMLSDLMHHCAQARLDFEDMLESARQLHREELVTHTYFSE